jgi:multicomponent Na+:H+ antiporter subunit G
MGWEQWTSCGFLLVGVFFAVTGSVGVLRMPDFYSRLHPAGKSDTLAQALILLGLLVLVIPSIETNYGIAIKLLLLTGLLFVTAPTSTHAISKAALLDPRMPRHWVRAEDSDAAASDDEAAAPGATDAEPTSADRRALAAEDRAADAAEQEAAAKVERGEESQESGEREEFHSLVDMGRRSDWDKQINEDAAEDAPADASEEDTPDE